MYLIRTVALALAVSLVAAAGAQAQTVRVIQQRPFLRRSRVELAPVTAVSVNDPMVRYMGVGTSLNYHLTEQWSGGLRYWRTIGVETSLYEKMQSDYSLLPRIRKTDSVIDLHAAYAPLYGKFALFNTWVVHFDTSVSLGLGVAQVDRGATVFMFDYGLSQRYFLTDWLTFNLDARHFVTFDDSLIHNISLGAGFGLFVPFSFQYKTLK